MVPEYDLEAIDREQNFIAAIFDLFSEWGAVSKTIYRRFAVCMLESSMDAEILRHELQGDSEEFFVDTNGTQLVIIDQWHEKR